MLRLAVPFSILALLISVTALTTIGVILYRDGLQNDALEVKSLSVQELRVRGEDGAVRFIMTGMGRDEGPPFYLYEGTEQMFLVKDEVYLSIAGTTYLCKTDRPDETLPEGYWCAVLNQDYSPPPARPRSPFIRPNE